VLLAVASVGLSYVHPAGNVRYVAQGEPMLAGSGAPQNVRSILEAKCADCHSNRTHWPIYSRIAPISWQLEHDVRDGRAALNFSSWAAMRSEDRLTALTRIAAEIRSGEMPPAGYVMVHRSKRLSAEEEQEISAWARAERKRIKTMLTEKQGEAAK
jgi:cytochrome c